jgi:thiamine-phosphate diphosphorylase
VFSLDHHLKGIYAIVDAGATVAPLDLLESLLAAGIVLVQYRAKGGVDRDLVRRMHRLTRAAGATLIVNDDLEAALDADGLHLGQDDLAALDARALRARLVGRLLGISCATPEQARAAAALGADYVGTGPFAATGSKRNARAPIGALGVRAVVVATSLPVAAIGGIGLENLSDVAGTGAAMAAVISALAHGLDPGRNARALIERWQHVTAPMTRAQ